MPKEENEFVDLIDIMDRFNLQVDREILESKIEDPILTRAEKEHQI